MASDLCLDPDTHDLLVQKNDLLVCKSADQVIQSLKIRLQTIKGEWFLDTTAGLPYYEDILVKNPNLPNIDNIIKAQIIDTDDVEEILEYTSSFDSAGRSFSVSFRVRSIYGEVELNETVIGV